MQLILESLSNLFASKLRSILALLGVLIGTASVVALVSTGELATRHALEQFKSLGTDLLAVSINPIASQDSSTSSRLSLLQAKNIKNSSLNITEIAPYTFYYAPLFYKDTSIQGSIVGATEDLQNVVKISLKQGRFISTLDKKLFYCVIGDGLFQKIKAIDGKDPIGQQIRVGNYFYTIVGIANSWPENMFIYVDIDNSIIIPIDNSFLLSKYVQIQNIVFRLTPGSNIDQVQNQITGAINQIFPGQQLYFRSPKQLIESMEKQRETLTLLLALIGSISLFVGGIGVMNIMLVSVVERRREIGIRMAVGATSREIGLMFIMEAIVLTCIGGILGILSGVIVSFVVATLSGWGFELFLLPPLVGFLVSALIGVFFGFYPAYQASKLDPIRTLRSE